VNQAVVNRILPYKELLQENWARPLLGMGPVGIATQIFMNNANVYLTNARDGW
jgi:hypothetical protein